MRLEYCPACESDRERENIDEIIILYTKNMSTDDAAIGKIDPRTHTAKRGMQVLLE